MEFFGNIDINAEGFFIMIGDYDEIVDTYKEEFDVEPTTSYFEDPPQSGDIALLIEDQRGTSFCKIISIEEGLEYMRDYKHAIEYEEDEEE